MTQMIIRMLGSEDWREYKRIRLESLQKEPLAFGSSYVEEELLSDDEWQRNINLAYKGIFWGVL
jgi:hypothetical protein